MRNVFLIGSQSTRFRQSLHNHLGSTHHPGGDSREDSRAAQRGYGKPARRLMAMACRVSRTTAAISTAIWPVLRKIPSEIISVVAPAGGCGAFKKTISPLVNPRESAAAAIRGSLTPIEMAGPMSRSPNSARLLQPATTPMRYPIIALRGACGGFQW